MSNNDDEKGSVLEGQGQSMIIPLNHTGDMIAKGVPGKVVQTIQAYVEGDLESRLRGKRYRQGAPFHNDG